MHIFINYLKVMLRTRSMLFWTLAFPMLLGLLFHFAFGGILASERFDPVPAGVVESEALEEEGGFSELLEELSKEGEEQILILRRYDSGEAAKEALLEGEIDGYYEMEDPEKAPALVLRENGLSQTILEEIAGNYFQAYAIMGDLYDRAEPRVDPEAAAAAAAEGREYTPPMIAGDLTLDEDTYVEILEGESHFRDVSNDEVDATIIYFYTLLGMFCMYGAAFGIYAVQQSEANLSVRAARQVSAPVSKLRLLGESLLASLLVLYAEDLILLVYMDKVLKVAFGHQTGYILFLTFLGCLLGIAFGAFLGASNRKSENFKTGIMLAITMSLCVLGGMMYQDLRYIIKDKLPLLDWINPITMITDGLYALYCYQDHALYYNACLRLALLTLVLFLAALAFLRRKRYDSI